MRKMENKGAAAFKAIALNNKSLVLLGIGGQGQWEMGGNQLVTTLDVREPSVVLSLSLDEILRIKHMFWVDTL